MGFYILGNGGYAQELCAQLFLSDHMSDFKGFIVLKNEKAFLIDDESIKPFTYPNNSRFIIGTANRKWRNIFFNHFLEHYPKNARHFPNVFAESAKISRIAEYGIGNVFCEFSLLNANAYIGNFNNLNIYSSVNHDCKVGDNNIFSPYSALMGFCTIENNNFFGTGTHVIPKINIGSDNIISAGETLFDDLSDKNFVKDKIVIDKK